MPAGSALLDMIGICQVALDSSVVQQVVAITWLPVQLFALRREGIMAFSRAMYCQQA